MATTTERKERLHTLPTNDAFAAHMHLVLSIVADFMRRVPRSVQREDLVAAGSIGLLHALRSNRHTCPEMLTAYARIRIRGAVIDELRRHDWSPRRRRTNATTQLPGVVISDHNNSGSSRSNAKTSGGTVTIKTDSASNGHGSHGRSYSGEKVEKAGVVVIGFDDLPLTHSLREEGPSPLEEFETRRGASEVRNAVDKLPPRERTIVRMRYFEEVPSKAIASTLGLSEARVSQLLARATLQLKQLLTEREGELDLAA